MGSQLGLDPERDGWIVALCAHIYYHTEEQSPLEDLEFDSLVECVANAWGDLSADLQYILNNPEEMRTTTCYIKLTPDQIERARREYGC